MATSHAYQIPGSFHGFTIDTNTIGIKNPSSPPQLEEVKVLQHSPDRENWRSNPQSSTLHPQIQWAKYSSELFCLTIWCFHFLGDFSFQNSMSEYNKCVTSSAIALGIIDDFRLYPKFVIRYHRLPLWLSVSSSDYRIQIKFWIVNWFTNTVM